ncbi:non-ribosomal peptide synthase/polyketide synthase [Marinicella sp. W31]|uniref:non-ribosomal peptide synthase/polyketide synthase n=1 Tax=Marinicella sp. W31 TaxID=3023713 RepID=UPI00375752C2
MVINEIIEKSFDYGVSLQVDEGELIVRFEKGNFPEDLKNLLKAHKHEIIEYLTNSGISGNNASNETNALLPRGDLSKIPVSSAQQRLWFIAQLEGGNAAYHIPGAVRLEGKLSRDALEQALTTIVERHETLRTVFKEVDGDVLQEIAPAESSEFDLEYRSLCDAQDVENALQNEAEEFNQIPFDLAKGPLIRGRLVQLSDQEHALLVTMHHIVSDGWSMDILIEEFNTLYEAYCSGTSNPLSPLPIQYADYAIWQRAQLNGDVLEQQTAYWKKHLADAPELLSLPTDHPRPSTPSYRGGMVDIELDAQLSEQVRTLALSEGMTTHMILYAVWTALLSRLSGQDQIVVGTPVANRQRHEVEGLIGFFVNTLALRVDLSVNPSVKTLLSQVRSVTLDGYANQDVPFEQVVELVQPERSLQYTPVFQAMFNFEQGDESGDLKLSNVSSEGVTLTSEAATQFDVTLSLSDDGKSITGQLEYASDLFEHETIERWSQYFSHLVTEFISNIDAPINHLVMLPDAERQQLMEAYNSHAAELPSGSTIHELFEAQVVQNPQAIALEAFGACLTYEVLNNRANQLAHQLIAQGVQSGDYVGLYLPRSLDVFVSMLAVMKAGGAYVMLDLEQPVERLQHIIEKTNMAVLLTDAERLSICDTHFTTSTLCLDQPEVQEQLATRSTDNPDVSLKPNAPALVYFTSGSTGTPKGAINSHSGVINTMWAMSQELELTSSDRVLQFAALSFDVVIEEVFPAWFTGAAVVLRDEEGLLSPEQLQAMLRRLDISVCELMSSYWSLWVSYLEAENKQPPECFRTVILGSDAVLMPAYNAWQVFDIPIVNVFGLTETGCTTLTYKAQGAQPYATRLPNGRPLANTKVYILDVAGNLAPEGVMGELCIGGAGVGLGYIGEPELTVERFVDNPFTKGTLYKTGDLARWLPGGLVEFIGRRDHQVKLRGFRIELGEVEAQLLTQTAIREAVVVLDESGETDRLVAYVTTNSDSELETEQLCQALNESLPEYMVPSIYVELETLPLTSSGKVDRKALPKPDSSLLQAEYEPPVGETETALAEIWQELLNVEQVSRNDNFFRLGGHSILAIRLASLIQKRLERNLNLQSLFEQPVLKDLSQALDRVELAIQTPITLADRSKSLPLSWAQQRLWFIAQLEGGNAAYHIAGSVSLAGELSNDALNQALQTIVARHESLRTVFNESDGEVWQEITASEDAVFNLQYCDLRGVGDQEGRLQEEAEEEHQAAFDLAKGPLIRGRLVQLADQEHVLLVTMHHIVSDGWSMGVLIQEFNVLYEAYCLNKPNPLSALPIQYADYAVWQRTELKGDVLAQQSEYWKKHLADAPELLSLPTDHPRPEMPSYRGGMVGVALDAQVSEQIRALALCEGMTVHMVLHAIWVTLLSRLNGEDQIVVGTPVANRQRHEVEGLIGFFINTLALRVDLSEDPTVQSLLSQVKSVTLGGYANQDVPFEQVVELLQPERSLRYTPLFQAMFNFEQDSSDQDLTLSGLSSDEVNLGSDTVAQFDLTLSLSDDGQGIAGHLEYASDLFEHETIERWSQYFSHLVAEFVSNLDAPVHELDMLPIAERQQLLETYNDNTADLPSASTIHELFEVQVVQNPQAIALEAFGQRLTYQDLNQRANQLAHHLMAQGVQSGDYVGLYLPRSLDVFVSMLAVMKAGGAYVMLDLEQPIERLQYIVKQTGMTMMLTDGEHLSTCDTHFATSTLCLDQPEVQEQLAEGSTDNPDVSLKVDAPALVYFTSGSTGTPKGAINSHSGVINTMWAMSQELELTSSDRVLQFAALSFDVVIEEVFPAWFTGAAVVLRDEEGLLSPEQLQAMLRRLDISVCELMSSYWSLWVSYLEAENKQPPECFRTVILGSDAILMPAYNTWQAFDIPIVNVFGLTETGCTTLTYEAQGPQAYTTRLPNGRPLANTKVYILDMAGNPVPEGVMGELCIGGAGVGLGYIGEPELTAERFVQNPFGEGTLYKTGDLARWLSGGLVEFIGRRDHQVKLRGFRIELGEIEAQLLNQPKVREAVVVLDESGDTGRLVAYITQSEGSEIDNQQLRQALNTALPEYMVPSIFIELETLPLTASGKVDRKALPQPDSSLLQAEYEPPVGETETALAEIWQELLNVEQVSRNDNFFRLGGHSLLAIRLVSLVQQRLERSLSLQSLFEQPILKGLSQILNEAELIIQNPIVLADRSKPLPLSWAQQRLWFIAQLEGGNAAYHISGSVHLEGELSSDALQHALLTIVTRHEALRTVFNEENGEIRQEIVAPEDVPFTLQYSDLREAENQDDQLQQEAEKEHDGAFDLAKGPLIRVRLVQLSNLDHVLLVTMHHIVSDGWSMGVLIQEFNALYEAYRLGKVNPLPELPIQYADYAAWQRNEFRQDVLAQQSEYWKKHLADVPELLSLPTDHPRPAIPSYRGGIVDIELDAQLSEQVRNLALREGMTVHMLLHAVWATLLSRLSGQDQIVVGAPVANRQRHEVEGLIGFFVNTLALRADISGTPNVKALLAQIKSITLDGYANQDIPFEQVVELVQPERSLRYTPLFQAMFTFEQENAEEDLALSGLSSNEAKLNANTVAQFDLSLSLSDDGKGITGILEYARDLFEHETIERWSQYFSHLVAEFVSNIDAPVNDLLMLPDAERQQLLEIYNDNTANLPSALTIHELFEAQVVQNPQAIALEAFGECLTYEELNNRANKLAHQLMAQGVQSGDYVGLYLPRSLDVFVSMLAVMKAGGAYVMLDLEQPVERLQHIIEKTNMAVLLTDAERLSICDTHFTTSTLCLDHPEVQQQLATRSTNNPDVSLKANAPALVYFTSGSTGTPKGAINSHSGVINTMWSMSQELELTSSDRVLQFAALSFDVVIEEVFPAWFTGAAVILRDEEGLLSPEQLQAMLRRLDISVCELMSSYWSLWVDYLIEKHEQPPECFRTVILGSDAVLMPAYNTWQAFDIPIVNVFGLTETGCTTLTYKAQGSQTYTTRLPNGRPLANTKVYILDMAGNPVPEGVMGELCIGGAGVGLGYIGEPELTAERFVQNPFGEGTLYKTGDLARWLSGGLVEFIGRRDHQVKLRGFRIELGEIEAQLLNQAAIREAVVVLDESGDTGRLVAYVTTNSDSELEIEQLRQAINESLPEYMVPSIFIELETLPLTASGKVDRKSLPKPDSSLLQAEYEPPVGETETALAEIWQELLNVEQVSRNDSFFSLGGHSLLIIRLIAELQAKELHADIRAIFDHSILKDLAAAIGQDSQSYYQAPANIIPANCTELTPDLLPLIDLEQHHIDTITAQVPGGVANIQDIYPLGPLQEGILFHHLLSSKEQGDTYIMPTLLSVPNSGYADLFIQALNTVIARHDVLRTGVFWDDIPHPVQVVLRETPIVVNDLTLDTSQDTLTQLHEHMAPGKLWMDLKEAPLLRLDRVADPESDQIFLILYEHHIINDHIGLEILIQEVEACLDAEEAGEILDLPPQIPYREFIAHTLMLTESGATQAYFESRLGDLDEPTLPFGLQDTQVDAAEISEFDYVFEDAFSHSLKETCLRLDISAASVFHLAWALVLGRCSGQEDVVFGTVLSGRLQGTQGAARSIGLFINTLPLRLSLAGNVEDALRQTHDELLSLLEHEQASLTLVRECTDLSSEAPLITSLLNYRREDIGISENTEKIEESDAADESNEVAMLDSYERTNYPLTLSVDDIGGEQFSFTLQAVTEIDGERVIGYMRTAMESLITAVSENDRSIKDLVILPKVERQQLLVELNQTQVDYPDAALIHSLFEEQVAMNPQGIALVYEGESLTYQALNQRSNQLAHYLMDEGVKPDTLVGLCIERSVEMIIAVLGILKAGGAYVPLDPTYPEARLAYQIEDADLNIIITQASLQALLIHPTKSVHAVCLDTQEMYRCLEKCSKHNPPSLSSVGLHAQRLAYVIYTSGTTGQPKGVMIEHRSLCNLTVMQKASFNLSSACHVLQFASIAFDAATWEMFMALAQGGTLVLPSSTEVKSPEALSALVEHYQITHATLPPSLLPLLDIERWAGVKTLIVAGEACAKQLATAWSQDRQFVNAYGPSEFTVCATAGAFSPSQSILHMGKPNQNTQVYVCNDDGGLLPQGVPGELLLGGIGLARGYLNRPELTAEKFIANPFYDASNPASSERLYRTGDLVRWLPDGNLEFLGRIDHQVKLRGFRIELGEIEAQLLNQAEIHEAVVILDKTADRLVAYVVAKEGLEINRELLSQALSDALPEYMVPSIYIELDALPLTSNGKVNRKALPKPEGHHLLSAEYAAPEGDTESVLAEIWQDLLGVDQASRHDNFFKLGGHSLLIIRLIAELQAKDLHADVRTILDNPILKDLAAIIDRDGQSYFQAPANLIPENCTELTPDLLPLVDLEQNHIDSITAQIPGGVANIQDIYPLGPLQEGILFHHLLDSPEQGDTYIIPTLLSVPNAQYADRFIRALNAVIARHDVLRTAFFWDDLPRPVQVVLRESSIVVNTLTLDTSQDALTQLHEHMAPGKVWMDLKQAPLLRLDRAADPQSDQVFLILYEHHISNDHVGLDILIQEVDIHLRAEEAGDKDALDLPEQVPYREFVAHALMLSESGATRAYFQSRFGDMDEPTLPFGLQDTQVGAAQITEFDYAFEDTFSVRLRQACSHLQISVASVFHLAWAVVLGRCSGRDDVVFGTVLSGRLQGTQGAARSIGLFINTLPLRLSLIGNVEDALKHTHQELLSLLEYEQASLALVRECADLSSDAPLFASLLNYRRNELENDAETLLLEKTEMVAESDTADDENEVTIIDDYERTNYPLTLAVNDLGGEQFGINLQAVAEIDGERVIEYLHTVMEALVTSVLDNAILNSETPSFKNPLQDLPILPEVERQHLLLDLNQTQVEYPDNTLIHTLFEEQVKANPDGIALVYEGESLTYQQLNERANQLAHYLIEQGVRPDTLVGLCLDRSLEMVIGLLGILKAGGAYVPLDPHTPSTRLQYQIDDANLSVLLTQDSLHEKLVKQNLTGSVQMICLDTDDTQDCLNRYSSHNPDSKKLGLHSQHLAYVIYTSGTTGQPKGVMVEHQALVNRIDWMQREYNLLPTDKVLQKTPYTFDVSVWEFLWTLSQGSQLVVAKPGGHQDTEYLTGLIAQQEISVLHFVPSLLKAILLDKSWAKCISLRKVFSSGEALAKNVQDQFFSTRVGCELHNLYGPTEAAIDVSFWACESDSSYDFVPIGKPIQNIEFYVVDGAHQLCPLGVSGELLIGGAGLARGYLNQPELTAEKFIANPFYDPRNSHSRERLYKTGDLVRWLPDDNLEYQGRIDHQIKLRGFRIELGEIESQLLNQAMIRDAVVILDEIGDEGRLVAYVVANDELKIDNNQLRQALSDTLPEYMIPEIYIELEALPLTSNGKVNRKALPKPEGHHLEHAAYEAPQGFTETVLAEIWQTLLPVEQISRHDNFFRLGGHSLLIIRLIAELQAKDLHAEVRTIFDNPVLKDLAVVIGKGSQSYFEAPANLIPADCKEITPDLLPLVDLEQSHIDSITHQIPGGVANIQDIYPLGPLQEGILFHHLLNSEAQGDSYILPTLLSAPNAVYAERFVQALNAVIVRHDVLRTAVFWDDLPHPVQVVLRDSPIVVNTLTLDASRDTRTQLREHMAPGRLWMDLTEAPLLRLEMAADPHSDEVFMLICQHHIINDHIGLDILINEVNAYLGAEDEGDKAVLDLPAQVPYREFIAHTLMLSEAGATQAYFESKLGDVDEPTLPFGLQDTQIDAAEINEFNYAFEDGFSLRLKEACSGLGISSASIFHLAWALVLGRCSGRDDVVFGTVLSGRLQGTQGAARSIGLFINTLPLRLKLSGNVKETLKQTHDELLGLLEHEQASLTLVHDCTDLSGEAPLITTLLNYRRDEIDTDTKALSSESEANHSAAEVDMLGGYERTNYPLSLSVGDIGGEQFSFNLQAVAEIDGERMIGYMRTAMEALITSVMRNDVLLKDLVILPELELQQLLVDMNQTHADYPDTVLIHGLFEERVKVNPDGIAIVYEDESLTYQQLNQRANQLAHYLIEQGVKPDTLVGLCFDRSLEMVIGMIGILKAGGAYVPLDPAYPKARLVYQIKDAKLNVILTQESLCAELSDQSLEGSVQAICLDADVVKIQLKTYSSANPVSETQNLNAQNLAYVIYTSGTTGQPKGVMIEHRSLCNLTVMQKASFNLSSACHVLQFASIAFDAATWEIFMALAQGGTLVMPSSTQVKSPEALSALVEHYQITHATLPPSLLPLLDIKRWAGVKTLIVAGEACAKQLATAWSLDRQFVNAYGPSEFTVCATAGAFSPSQSILHMGKPNQNTQVYVCNDDSALLPQGVPGELLLGGIGLARGYLNRPELTAEKFITNPFYDASNPASSERLYRTGDLVRWLPDGNLEFLGRIDHQVKLRGFRIELGEIEAQLLNQTEICEAIVVLDRPDNERDEENGKTHAVGGARLVAYVVAGENSEIDNEQLNLLLSESLPKYMVPTVYIELEALPLNRNGKVDRKALPDPEDYHLSRAEYEAPQGTTEVVLAEIWQTLLKVEQVSRHDNFFSLGGNSLLAIRLVSLVQQRLERRLNLQNLFGQPVLKDLSQALDDAQHNTQAPITQVARPHSRSRQTESIEQQSKPPVEGAKLAPDGHFYIEKDGKYYRVDS